MSQLTLDSGAEVYASLAPDGKTIAYASARSGNWDIYVQRVGGTNPINLTKDSPADESQASFSPDGERIVFRSDRDGGGIFVMGATGESVKRLTDFGCNPAWSPDSREIAMTSECFDDPKARWGTSTLWVVDATAGEPSLVCSQFNR